MVFCILQPIAHKGATMVEFVHLPIHVLAQQDGLVQIATQVSAYISIYITILDTCNRIYSIYGSLVT